MRLFDSFLMAKLFLSAGIFGLGAIFGGFAAALLGSKFGRRKSLFFLTIPDILGWILIASSQNLPMILVGRFLQGFASAGYSPSIWVNTVKSRIQDELKLSKTWDTRYEISSNFIPGVPDF